MPRARAGVGVVPALVAGAVAVGIAERVWILLSSQGALDGDEAVWGLMARHFLHGEPSTFFWGQAYGGTQEVVLTVPLIWLFGSSVVVLKVVPIVLWAVAAGLVWRIGRRIFGDARAEIAAALFWAWPTFFVWKSTKAHGFYGAALVCGLGAFLLALRLRERDSRLDFLLFGLALGLGWWATPQIAILALPAVAWLVWRRPRALRGVWLAAPAFMLGSLPWWLYNAQHGWASLHLGRDESSKVGHLHNLVSTNLPTALGLRLPYSLAWLPDVAVAAPVYAACLLGFVYLLARRRSRLEPVLLAAIVFPVLYLVSPYTWLGSEPRYLTLISPILALLVAYAAVPGWRAVAVVVAAVALSVAGATIMERDELGAAHADGVVVPSDLHPLVRALEALGVRHLYANYWVAYPIDYESGERIVAAKIGGEVVARDGRLLPAGSSDRGSEGRYPKYNRVVNRSRDAAYVFVAGGTAEPSLRPRLLRLGYRLVRTNGFDVYLAPAR